MIRALWLGLAALWLAACAQAAAPTSAPLPNPLERVAVDGRYALTEDGAVFGFPGAKLELDAPGRVVMDVEAMGEQVALDVAVNDGPFERIDLAPGDQTLTLGPDGPHRLTLVRRNEDWQGALRVRSVSSPAGPLGPAPALPGLRLLFIGDSITAGAGTDVAHEDAGLGKPLDNARLAFPRVLGERLGAQVHQVAYGGRGVIRDWRGYPTGREGVLNAPAFYGLATPGLDAPWDPQAFVPDAVVVALGTNDFNTGVPDQGFFVDSYAAFLGALRADYPDAPILVLNSPMTGGDKGETLMRYLDRVAARAGDNVHRLDTQRYEGRPSVVGHPTDAQHQAIADEIEPVLRALLGQ